MDEEQQWWDELYRETGPQLLAYLGQKLGDRGLAEDLLQETFAAAIRQGARLRAASSARAYLFGIARNLAITAFRRRRATEPISREIAAENPAPDPRIELLREGIARLKPDFREALELRLQQELSYEEIAEALEVPVGTVRSRLHAAVRELRRILRHTEAEWPVSRKEL